MSSSNTVLTENDLIQKMKDLELENKQLHKLVEFSKGDNDLARRTVSHYAEELMHTQKTLNILCESIQNICVQKNLSPFSKVDHVLKEIDLAKGINGMSYLKTEKRWLFNGKSY